MYWCVVSNTPKFSSPSSEYEKNLMMHLSLVNHEKECREPKAKSDCSKKVIVLCALVKSFSVLTNQIPSR